MRARLNRFLLPTLIALGLLLTQASPALADSQTHVVQPGENLFRIALNHGVSLDALRAANGIRGDLIYVGQVLVIPGAGNPPAAPSDANLVHVVQRGETLFLIGLKYGLTWTAIQAANNLPGSTVYAGQRLVIPTGGSPAPTSPAPESSPPASPDSSTVHVVQRGETLFLIGLKYGLTWTAIQAANGLPGTTVFSGQRLIIPVGGSPAPSGVVAPPAPPAGDGKRFLVDLSEQRLYAYEGDTLVRTTLVSTGRAATPTVVGTFKIYARYDSQRMRGPGYDLPNVPYVQYFYRGYGLHGTYWHNNFGTPMSAGCVNMPTAEAEWAYSWADYGTPVTVQW